MVVVAESFGDFKFERDKANVESMISGQAQSRYFESQNFDPKLFQMPNK